MRSLRRTAVLLPLIVPLILFGGLFCSSWHAARAADDPGGEHATPLVPPSWKIGDTWMVETLTQRIQAREVTPDSEPARVRWQFEVTKIEKVAGNDCYRLDVKCLARGRIRPQATIWCDRKNLFLRQFQTQLAFNGRYRTVQESYACSKGPTAPVIAFVNALPLALPAFMPEGAKAGGTFVYESQPMPAGSKDPSIIRFAHTMDQQTQRADAKLLSKALPDHAKALDDGSMVQITLQDHERSLVQLWKPGEPWPVYVDDGRTQARLIPTENND